ncbi:protein flightless-1 [Toxorhynchites rutilus septentrionalis]|uniref:protein flightless-1 n=1 Tax=Toxorhynchites rutilus septentrionalis TaxID=329112 RepID=UPI00247AD056|nr:protein flightless-1 [Toxorhynchites rutilus septentrionalis]
MSTTGVLPFVRGIDFTHNDFRDGKFPKNIKHMSGVQWLKLDRTGIKEIPEEMGKLLKLEHLSMKNNQLEKLYGELTDLNCLRSLNMRRNNIKSSGIPNELFDLDELTTLDLSHNKLKEVPEGLEKAKSLLVLNLSNNQIESIPPSLFINLTDLLFLDLSNNKLETLPPQTRRLSNLQTLILNDNPLELFQLRQLPSLQNLVCLQMRNTQRTLTNFPTSLDSLSNLQELDLSQNALSKIPDALYNLANLKRLNLNDNVIQEISPLIENLAKLETLNLSRNQLVLLPSTLCKLQSLRRLYVNDNQLNFEGIPSSIGKLGALEVFSASNNQLEMVPEGLCRCGSLKKLNLSSNKLITLPEAIHLLTDMEQLDLRNNPDLVMPPKPVEVQRGDGLAFYNIDFSLQTQLRLAGANVPTQAQTANSSKDPIARKLRLRRGARNDSADQDSAKILKGMQDIAKEKNALGCDEEKVENLKPKRWDETLEKPPVDYSEIFEEEDGQYVGLTVWEIENFLPNKIEEAAHGKFYEGDCYIVLKTVHDDAGQLSWEIYFWIGTKATLDKRACAAIHAVNLRNYLGARCRTIREEQADESDEFLALFDTEVTYIEGGRTPTGFYTIENLVYIVRLYRIHDAGANIHLEPVEVTSESLDPGYVFLLDTGLQIFMWYGSKSKNTLKSKARLIAEKMNKNERKNKAEIFQEYQSSEGVEFWKALGFPDGQGPGEKPSPHVDPEFSPIPPRLYQIQLGMGYLELPQVEHPGKNQHYTILNSKNVYILDCYLDLFVWFGKKSTRLVRAAAIKLSQELFNMIERPEYALITRVQEGTETQVFKSKFTGWDEIIAVDFTRTAQSVARTGADLTGWAKKQETKADLAALFMPRQPPMTLIEAQQLADDWNYDLDVMESFVLEGKKFVRLPEEELGIFYTGECYVFLCRYCLPVDDDEDEEEGDTVDNAANKLTKTPAPPAEEIQCVVYFWQGREAGNMGWLTFTFTLQKKFKSMFGEELEVVRIHQQQENLKFMSHFKGKFTIKTGRRKEKLKTPQGKQPVEFYHLRSNGSALCTRLIQVKTDATLLNSAFCYILFVPFETDDDSESGIVYVWIGSKTSAEESRLIQEIAEDTFNSPWVSLQILHEGEEPENFFWVALGGRKPYDTDADYMNYTRLFRCSNEKGYFTVAEKCSDFCQDDLADDDIMILDNGEQVFLWLGSRCSEVEIKLAYKSAQVYIQHMRIKQPERPRKLFLTLKNKESKRFTKCFHGWSAHKRPPE